MKGIDSSSLDTFSSPFLPSTDEASMTQILDFLSSFLLLDDSLFLTKARSYTSLLPSMDSNYWLPVEYFNLSSTLILLNPQTLEWLSNTRATVDYTDAHRGHQFTAVGLCIFLPLPFLPLIDSTVSMLRWTRIPNFPFCLAVSSFCWRLPSSVLLETPPFYWKLQFRLLVTSLPSQTSGINLYSDISLVTPREIRVAHRQEAHDVRISPVITSPINSSSCCHLRLVGRRRRLSAVSRESFIRLTSREISSAHRQ